MRELLDHPAVQAGLAPFVAGLMAALLFKPVKLSGLAVVTGFAVAVFLIAGFEFTPLTTTRKIFLVCLVAPVAGIGIDWAGKGRRGLDWLAGLVCAAVTGWVFLTVLKQKEGTQAWILGGGTAVFVGWLVATMVSLRTDAMRAGAAALGLGLGVGIAAVLGASASFGQYGIALAASAGAFMIARLVLGPGTSAGATLALPAALIGGLLASGTLVLASLPWMSMAALALVPLAVRLPLPESWPTWIKSGLASVYAIVPAAIACALAWQATAAGTT